MPARWKRCWLSLSLLLGGLYVFAQEPPRDGSAPEPPRAAAAPAVPAGEPFQADKLDLPIVVVEKRGPKSVNIGRPLTIEIVVKNVGAAAAFQLRIVDDIPPRARFIKADPQAQVSRETVAWTLDRLDAGAERRFLVELQPQGEGELTGNARVTFSSTAATSFSTRITKPQLAVKMTAPETAIVGEPLVFRIEVVNPGSGEATNVVIRDQLPGGLRHAQGDFIEADMGALGAGETRSVNLAVKAIKPGRQVNQVTVTADGGLRAATSASVGVGQPVLRLYKTGPSQRFLNTEAVYSLEIVNTGDAPARNVQLLDALPAALDFVGASDNARYDKDSHSVQWNFEAIKPGETRLVNLKVTAVTAGEIRNRAVLRAEPNIDEKAEMIMKVVGVPAILLEVVDKDDPLEVGAETQYEIRVVNQGTAPNTNVQVVIALPDGLSPLRAEADVSYRIQGRQLIFAPLPQLGPKANTIFRVFVRGTAPGDHRFKVQLNSDQLRIPVAEEESTHVYKD